MDAAAVAANSAGQTSTERKVVRKRWRDTQVTRKRHMMRLHILSGSFFLPRPASGSASAGGGRRAATAAMDPSVWSRLPDDMVWRVLGLVPPAKRFQLHLVSRKWRQVLTSPNFRNTIAAAPERLPPPQQRVVACVSAGLVDPDDTICACRWARPESLVKLNYKVVDVDLSSLVPSWFWKPHALRPVCSFPYCSFSVVAAGDGLVCICNHIECQCDRFLRMHKRRPVAATRYCVLDPVSRTSAVLPPAPFGRPMPLRLPRWLPLSAGAAGAGTLTMYRWDYEGHRPGWEVATCHLQLAAAGGGGGRWRVLHSPPVPAVPATRRPPVLAQCGGQIFWYHAGRLHVLAAPPPDGRGAKRRRLEEEVGGADADADADVGVLQVVETLDGPSVALLGLDAAAIGYKEDSQDERVFLVEHRGAILLVAQLMRRDAAAPAGGAATYTWDPDLVAGVWRLARRGRSPPERPSMAAYAWEPVSQLDVRQAKQLVQYGPVVEGDVGVCGAYVVRDRLCLEMGTFLLGRRRTNFGVVTDFVLELDHDAGEWQLLVDDQKLVELDLSAWTLRCAAPVVELRPH